MSIDVGSIQDFPDGKVSVVTAGRAEIGIINWRGRIHAISSVCTHQGGPLCRGVLTARLSAAKPGAMEAQEESPVIACPWHGWEFDITTGQAIWDANMRVRVFPVEIVAGRVLVETTASAAG